MTLTPVQFGEAIKVEGDHAGAAAKKLVEDYQAGGKPATRVTPKQIGDDVLVLTDEQADGYNALMDAQLSKAKRMFPKSLLAEIISTVTFQSRKNNPDGFNFFERAMKRISNQLIAESQAEQDALTANPRVVQSADILPVETEESQNTESLVEDISGLDVETFLRDYANADQPVLVELWADWCGPCNRQAPMVEELAKEYEGKLKVVKVDVDSSAELTTYFKTLSIPQLLLFNGGEEIARETGGTSKKKIDIFVRENLPTGTEN